MPHRPSVWFPTVHYAVPMTDRWSAASCLGTLPMRAKVGLTHNDPSMVLPPRQQVVRQGLKEILALGVSLPDPAFRLVGEGC